jgi:hypothetical protein
VAAQSGGGQEQMPDLPLVTTGSIGAQTHVARRGRIVL